MTNELAARRVALDALHRIEVGDAYANLVVPKTLDRSKLSDRDRRFVTELVYGATRMRRFLDTASAPHITREPDAAVRTVLRLGAYQVLCMNVPAHAAVSTSVSLAPKRAQGFVNAILRRIADAGVPTNASNGERLSYPDWLVHRLEADLGTDRAMAALEAMNHAPRPHTRQDGYVQDPASGWVADLVDAQPGQRVVDVCAAPGGKATALGHTVTASGVVVAADVRGPRVNLIAQNARTTGTRRSVAPVIADGHAPPLRAAAFDRVLGDAPCSGLGVLHRRPDARWRVEPEAIPTLASGGWRLLQAASQLVRPGGVLVYSVCTVTNAETKDVADRAVRELEGFSPLDPPSEPWQPHGPGALLLPQTAGTDGMFVLRLARS